MQPDQFIQDKLETNFPHIFPHPNFVLINLIRSFDDFQFHLKTA